MDDNDQEKNVDMEAAVQRINQAMGGGSGVIDGADLGDDIDPDTPTGLPESFEQAPAEKYGTGPAIPPACGDAEGA